MRLLFIFFLFGHLSSFTQTTTDRIVVEGEIEKPLMVDWTLLKTFRTESLDSLSIYNHEMQLRRVIKNIKGVPLKDVLGHVKLIETLPKKWSEFYFVCIASDGYKVVYSWNEVFNNPTGNKILVVPEEEGTDAATQADRMVIVSASDEATGRRYVKGLSKILVKRAE